MSRYSGFEADLIIFYTEDKIRVQTLSGAFYIFFY